MAKDTPTRSVEVPIKANPNEVEPLAMTRLGTVWQVRTTDSMRAILAEGYLDGALGHGLRTNDKVEVTCLATTPASFATLAISEVRHPEPGEPRVITRVLFKSEGK